ncbi:hypothetical protein [Microtetraspora malaysiensis]|nr:hypothetical protein [Microtetraspora malaysiensis]
MKTRVHAVARILALSLISLFFTASALVEIFGDDAGGDAPQAGR